jgi:hypothetical protein
VSATSVVRLHDYVVSVQKTRLRSTSLLDWFRLGVRHHRSSWIREMRNMRLAHHVGHATHNTHRQAPSRQMARVQSVV